MGMAKRFDGVLWEEAQIHAAWLPVTNTFALGDYGLVTDGVFHKMGNVEEYGVGFKDEEGQPTSIRFRSEGSRVRRFVGDTEVNVFPDSDIEAKLVIEFTQADSFYISADLNVSAMTSLNQVARDLRACDGWRRKFRVVWAIYTVQNCTILATREGDSSVEIRGKANALQLMEGGKAEAGLELSSKTDVGLDIVGKSGVVGLSLFKLRWFGDGVRVLAADDPRAGEVDLDDQAEIEDDL
jgi:hypothetical protein